MLKKNITVEHCSSLFGSQGASSRQDVHIENVRISLDEKTVELIIDKVADKIKEIFTSKK